MTSPPPEPDAVQMPARTPKPTTPRPRTAGEASEPCHPQKPADPSRPLNVTDALTYLDAVKIQFHDRPDVYNNFLDIMKDFKSEVIDTPGVIERVSMLFHGSPSLIQGFNTFLPPGYRIDISSDPSDPNMITVTTPMGTTTQSTAEPARSRDGVLKSSIPIAPGPPYQPMSRPVTPFQLSFLQQPMDSLAPGLQPPSTTAAASFLGNLNNKLENRPAGEFNHAIQYLNRIKARFADDPDVYKQFLEILQTYQKEQRQLQDSQVYRQVQALFKEAPDLLAEFKDFLPEAPIAVLASNNVDKPSRKLPTASIPPAKRRRKAQDKDTTPIPSSRSTTNRTKKVKHTHRPGEPESPHFTSYGLPTASPPHPTQSATLIHSHAIPQSTFAHLPIMPATHPSVMSPPDELLFFERAKRTLESKDTYEEFLKLLNLYSKDIIDTKTLVDLAQAFLGDGELLTQFKEVAGYDDRQDNVEYGPPGSIRTGPPEPVSAQPAGEGEGPSYRRLPDSEIRLACSGRDQLCRSVLNDVWVSHPTWASEEAGFISHKKNAFEEQLHKSEEERHEYHVQLEALARTIALFEPLNARIEEMTNEERAALRLKADFGGPSKSIYHRILKKVYGRDAGSEIIQALQECPSYAVPVVLARLKTKDEEWRRAQREWNKTWREVDAKNFYKSLDHQGIAFKTNDKRCITAKHFVGNIETIKADQMRKRERQWSSFAAGSPGHQLEFDLSQTSVLQDILRLVYSFLDHSHAQYTAQERRSIASFLRSFVPLLCMFSTADFDAACGLTNGVRDDDTEHEVLHVQRSGSRSVGGGVRHNSPVAAGDLRRQLLRAAQDRALRTEGFNATQSNPTSPNSVRDPGDLDNKSVLFEDGSDRVWIRISQTATRVGPNQWKRKPFFCNTTFYTMLCLLQLMYSRVLICKEAAQQTAKTLNPTDCNPIAVDLGLDDPAGPAAVLAQAMEILGDRRPGKTADVFYLYFWDACEKLFDSELEPGLFEEHMRWFFGNKAFYLFTLDKLIAAFVKQVQSVVSDNKCQELWALLRDVRRVDALTNQDMIRYRRESEKHVGSDEHLYRVEWDAQSKKMYIQLLDADDPSVGGDRTAMGRWQEYTDSYVLLQPTEWVSTSQKRERGGALFLRKHASTDETPRVRPGWDTMRIRITPGTYKLLYEPDAEAVLVRERSEEEERELRERARARNEERSRSRWLDG
ncbi:hypothetical protein EDC04DRAFT_2886647 [Pisolithus marmoratus]|nr:hypothetical protein EDC04DRAFT_2886647 [Pisolithus marmoratus]